MLVRRRRQCSSALRLVKLIHFVVVFFAATVEHIYRIRGVSACAPDFTSLGRQVSWSRAPFAVASVRWKRIRCWCFDSWLRGWHGLGLIQNVLNKLVFCRVWLRHLKGLLLHFLSLFTIWFIVLVYCLLNLSFAEALVWLDPYTLVGVSVFCNNYFKFPILRRTLSFIHEIVVLNVLVLFLHHARVEEVLSAFIELTRLVCSRYAWFPGSGWSK